MSSSVLSSIHKHPIAWYVSTYNLYIIYIFVCCAHNAITPADILFDVSWRELRME